MTVLAAATDPSALGGVAGWAVQLMDTLGVAGAAIAIALENVFPPIPSEVILPLAGFTASQGTFGLVAAIVGTTIGSVAGAAVLYLVGALVGRDRTRALVARIPLVAVEDVDRSEAFFARHARTAVFVGRMVPVFRSLISVPAGVERMPVATFLLLTAAGSAIWNTVFVCAGYLLGENWSAVQPYAGVFQWVVVAAVVGAVGWFVVARLRTRSRA
ncbi:DedA family protein [Cellulomonas sp. PhB150]|uniref:DedA family protein n=1 Tax=Cellulomonas sp. PhB150 TaxID=2485188 RepID=UPI000F47B33F|nr:DedA family protein [Cellulomonas sp. PhB150]ROS30578.1 membrane protein DedA with SNARE-associated domain [Cellulomonas sp. PhB150]